MEIRTFFLLSSPLGPVFNDLGVYYGGEIKNSSKNPFFFGKILMRITNIGRGTRPQITGQKPSQTHF